MKELPEGIVLLEYPDTFHNLISPRNLQIMSRVFPCILFFIAVIRGKMVASRPLFAGCDVLGGFDECPDFLDENQWRFYTENCCDSGLDFSFHCQEQTTGNYTRIVAACLQNVTCNAGEYAYLRQEPQQSSSLSAVFIECLSCQDHLYNPLPRKSFHFRYPYCLLEKQTCSSEYGKVEVTKGNATQDTRCRCLLEEDWVPEPATGRCLDLEGFNDNDGCSCVRGKIKFTEGV